jgi:hypothetical protein
MGLARRRLPNAWRLMANKADKASTGRLYPPALKPPRHDIPAAFPDL